MVWNHGCAHPGPCVWPHCVCSVFACTCSFAGLIRRRPQPTFSDTAITDHHSDNTIFQLRAHWVQISWSIGSEKLFRHVPQLGVEPLNSCVKGIHPIHYARGSTTERNCEILLVHESSTTSVFKGPAIIILELALTSSCGAATPRSTLFHALLFFCPLFFCPLRFNFNKF